MDRSGEDRMRDVVASADRVLVVAGRSYDARHRKAHQVLAELPGRRAVEELLDALACEAFGPLPTDLDAPDGPTVVFLEGRSVAATVTLADDDLLLAPALWPGATRLIDPSALHALLADHE